MRLLELDSYNMENDRTFLKSIEEHVKDPYIRERLINRLEWYMVMANRCQCFYYMSACMGIVMPTLILLLNCVSRHYPVCRGLLEVYPAFSDGMKI